MVIRDEKPSDREVISDGTSAAFRNLAISNHTEQFIIRALRDAGALTVSLVAEIDGRVVGHIAFSPVTISDGSSDWYSLGPISGERFMTRYQRHARISMKSLMWYISPGSPAR